MSFDYYILVFQSKINTMNYFVNDSPNDKLHVLLMVRLDYGRTLCG